MASLRKKLPPTNSLVAFEAAARHLNFTHAAKELLVTQAAVSRHIKVLEDHLGLPLFRRLPRALQLTPQGRRLQAAVTMGLEHIANTAADLRLSRGDQDVTVSTSVTFASYWLMARVAKFRAAYPELEIRLVASAPVADLAVAGIDLAVRYGDGNWPDVAVVHLMNNEVFPVCAPSYLEGREPLRTPEDLLNETLLHLVEHDHNWVRWDSWLKALGVDGKPTRRGHEFDNYLILVQAALDGQGIALGGGRLADDFLARGSLVRPLDATLNSERGFYLLTPKDVTLGKSACLFRNWILAEAKGGAVTNATTPVVR